MSRNQQHSSNVPDAGKLLENDKCDLTDSRADSGFISSGNLMLSGEISEEIVPEPYHHRSDLHSAQSDSGIIEDTDKKSRDSSMHIDSGVCFSSELSLSEKISKLKLDSNLGLNDLDNPKLIQPPEDSKQSLEDAPWGLYFEQDEDGDTHLHMAIIHAFPEIALAIIRAAPHPRLLDTPNDSAQTPLHLAVQTRQYPIVRWLIIAGAKPCPRDAQGNSPLHLAAKMGDFNCLKAIIEPVNPKHREAMALSYSPLNYETPNLDQWNYLGQTCVHIAAKYCQLEVLKHLVARGADINAREGLEGLTALHFAVQNRDEKMVKYILDECRTARPEITSYGGINALQWCIIVPETIRQCLKMRGLDSPYSSEDESSEDDDEEMTHDSPIHKLGPNLVDASA
ncbi:unnamed protein product [Ceutorhynchus assimilis]|uniref:NF-kappa-B inhibitor cactus n=1 Tax=Ceutorhynchus assimilis TaxID=467358 RepID=A0A9N9Q8B2_9CUCU|nr:unnamed protein product [Ceutorhynchus assimilis]